MSDKVFAEFCASIADDLKLLATMHDREIEPALLQALQQSGFPDSLSLVMDGEQEREISQLMRDELAKLDADNQKDIDNLAVDYTAIYISNTFGASPYESVWLDEESLKMQQPMFEIRDWYQKYKLEAEDWRTRSDDHLVYQLMFMSHLFALQSSAEIANVARFMDEHLLRWVEDFARSIAKRCESGFYAALVAITALYAKRLRLLLEEHFSIKIPSKEEIERRMLKEQKEEVPTQYVPGVAPSW